MKTANNMHTENYGVIKYKTNVLLHPSSNKTHFLVIRKKKNQKRYTL